MLDYFIDSRQASVKLSLKSWCTDLPIETRRLTTPLRAAGAKPMDRQQWLVDDSIDWYNCATYDRDFLDHSPR